MHLCERNVVYDYLFKNMSLSFTGIPVDTDIKTHCLRSIRHSAFQLWSLLSEAVFMCASSLLYPTVYLQTGPAPGHGP